MQSKLCKDKGTAKVFIHFLEITAGESGKRDDKYHNQNGPSHPHLLIECVCIEGVLRDSCKEKLYLKVVDQFLLCLMNSHTAKHYDCRRMTAKHVETIVSKKASFGILVRSPIDSYLHRPQEEFISGREKNLVHQFVVNREKSHVCSASECKNNNVPL